MPAAVVVSGLNMSELRCDPCEGIDLHHDTPPESRLPETRYLFLVAILGERSKMGKKSRPLIKSRGVE